MPGYLWRDERTCVPVRDCNCRTPYGKIIAPGSVEESDDGCEVCQCLDNEYVCDSSRCSYGWSTPFDNINKNLSIGTRKPRPPGPTTAPPSCSKWSDWINDYKNTAWGDYETKTPEQLNKMGFCLNGRVIDIECRDVKNNKSWKETRDRDVTCTLDKGLQCFPARQPKGGRCQDYKIRYFCECFGGDGSLTDESTTIPTTTTIMIWTTTARPRRLEQCQEHLLYPLLQDHVNIPDSSFTASSSRSSQFGPSNARFTKPSISKKDHDSGTSWVAGKLDADQHIQVDLGTVTLVDGFEVSGHPTANEYVTSFFVLYGEDDTRFSYINNKIGIKLSCSISGGFPIDFLVVPGKPMLFRGPLAHDGRSRHVLPVPIDARYIRIEPQTWKHAIAMRFELFGCDTIGENVVHATTPSPSGDICGDQMGIENGVIDDHQITMSSVHGQSSHVRLGSESAWVPATHSRKESVKVDFLETRNLSGIITQGHADGHAWVESFAGIPSRSNFFFSNYP